MLLGPLFWYCETQGFHTFLGLRRLDPHQGSALDLSGAYNIPRPPAMLSNDLRSLHILSKTRLSIPHLLGGGKILSVFCRGGGENFLTLSLQENYIPPTHRKNVRPLVHLGLIRISAYPCLWSWRPCFVISLSRWKPIWRHCLFTLAARYRNAPDEFLYTGEDEKPPSYTH